jgi:hypothetical protein
VRLAAVGDGWHLGVVTVHAEETQSVLDVFGMSGHRRYHTGRMAVPGGVAYLVATPPTGQGAMATAVAALCARYDPPVVVQIAGGTTPDVVVTCARNPITAAVDTFFTAAGEPATLPGFGGAPPFQVKRGTTEDDELRTFCTHATTRRGTPVAWAIFRGDAISRNAAQALRYVIPYLRPRLH